MSFGLGLEMSLVKLVMAMPPRSGLCIVAGDSVVLYAKGSVDPVRASTRSDLTAYEMKAPDKRKLEDEERLKNEQSAIPMPTTPLRHFAGVDLPG